MNKENEEVKKVVEVTYYFNDKPEPPKNKRYWIRVSQGKYKAKVMGQWMPVTLEADGRFTMDMKVGTPSF